MKNLSTLLLLLLTLNNNILQKKNDAATLISTAQINQLLNCNVTDGKSIMGGKYCTRKSADSKIQVIIQYTDFGSSKTATDMLKLAHDENSKNTAQGKKAVGIYTKAKAFTEGGELAYYMTSPGDVYSPGNGVRLQFVLGNCLFSFDTSGIDMEKVIPKLTEIYKIIKGNYK